MRLAGFRCFTKLHLSHLDIYSFFPCIMILVLIFRFLLFRNTIKFISVFLTIHFFLLFLIHVKSPLRTVIHICPCFSSYYKHSALILYTIAISLSTLIPSLTGCFTLIGTQKKRTDLSKPILFCNFKNILIMDRKRVRPLCKISFYFPATHTDPDIPASCLSHSGAHVCLLHKAAV